MHFGDNVKPAGADFCSNLLFYLFWKVLGNVLCFGKCQYKLMFWLMFKRNVFVGLLWNNDVLLTHSSPRSPPSFHHPLHSFSPPPSLLWPTSATGNESGPLPAQTGNRTRRVYGGEPGFLLLGEREREKSRDKGETTTWHHQVSS